MNENNVVICKLAGIEFSTYTAPVPRRVIVRGQTTVVIWNDGTRTRSTCAAEDTFDPVIGFSRCLCKKMFTRKQFDKIMRKVEMQNDPPTAIRSAQP